MIWATTLSDNTDKSPRPSFRSSNCSGGSDTSPTTLKEPSYLATRTFQEYNEGLSNLINSPVISVIRDLEGKRSLLLNLTKLTSLVSVTEEINRYINTVLSNNNFKQSFTGHLLNNLNIVRGNYEYEAIKKDTDNIQKCFEKKDKQIS